MTITPDTSPAAVAMSSDRRPRGPVVAPPGVEGTFVVKVQLPVLGPPLVRIYDETRTVDLYMPADHARADDVARAVAREGAAVPKAYFRARAVDGGLQLLLGRPVSLRPW